MKRPSKQEKVQATILTQGHYSPSDIQVTKAESNRKIDDKLESQIDEVWEKTKRTSEILGKICYNGTLYRLNSLSTGGYFTSRIFNY